MNKQRIAHLNSTLDCILREYYEETGLTLINPKLQGISYFIFVAEEFEGILLPVAKFILKKYCQI